MLATLQYKCIWHQLIKVPQLTLVSHRSLHNYDEIYAQTKTLFQCKFIMVITVISRSRIHFCIEMSRRYCHITDIEAILI